MAEAYIIDATRTPTGRRRGSLQDIHGADLGAHVIKEIVSRNAIPQEEYDDVIFGCVDAVGPLAGNIARTCWLTAGYDLTVPGVTIDRQCGSSQQAVHFAAQSVMSGTQDVIIAGGVQTMSKIPIGSAMIAIEEGGILTPAVASQTCDASSAVLIVSEAAVKRYDLKPRARIHAMDVMGDDPVLMLTAPIPATQRALKRAGMTVNDIDVAECNEAFAPVPMAWMKDTGMPHEKTNVNGGAIALGHPLGATGTKLFTTLLHELERRGGRYGLQTMCEGGGVANVTIIERL